MDKQAIAEILAQQDEELKAVKYNKNGTVNQASLYGTINRAHRKLRAAGLDYQEAYQMAGRNTDGKY